MPKDYDFPNLHVSSISLCLVSVSPIQGTESFNLKKGINVKGRSKECVIWYVPHVVSHTGQLLVRIKVHTKLAHS